MDRRGETQTHGFPKKKPLAPTLVFESALYQNAVPPSGLRVATASAALRPLLMEEP